MGEMTALAQGVVEEGDGLRVRVRDVALGQDLPTEAIGRGVDGAAGDDRLEALRRRRARVAVDESGAAPPRVQDVGAGVVDARCVVVEVDEVELRLGPVGDAVAAERDAQEAAGRPVGVVCAVPGV